MACRKRNWCFTLNNYTEEEVAQIIEYFNEKAEYIFQEEIGENGTEHLQGFVSFKNPQRQEFQKNVSKRIHWEICKGSKRANIEYCSKKESRTGQIYSNFYEEIIDDFDINIASDWQKEILELIKEKPDKRTINWSGS